MSQLPDDIGLFFRYTIPGTVFVAWIVAGTPLSVVHRIVSPSTGIATLFLGFLASMILIGGWVAYSGYYPVWQAVLLRTHVIRDLRSHTEVRDMIRTVGVMGVTPKSVWSFFLWNESNEPLRTRVKTLANYAHSSFMAAGGLIIYPIVYAVLRFTTGYTSVLSRLSLLLSLPLGFPASYLEVFFLLWSIATGVIIVIEGRTRWIESDSVQFLLFVQKKERVAEILKSLSAKKS